MNRTVSVSRLGGLLAITAAFAAPLPSLAQSTLPPAVTFDGQQAGWLEGTVHDTQGNIVNPSRNVRFTITRQGGTALDVVCDPNLDNLFSVRNLRPGIYDITIPQVAISSSSQPYCPIRYFGVVIKPGVRTFLNIVMDQGTTLEERGNPTVPTVDVTIVSEQLTRLQKQVDDLKAQLAALQAKPPAADAKPAAPSAAPPPAK